MFLITNVKVYVRHAGYFLLN